jgi:hypothetical protein
MLLPETYLAEEALLPSFRTVEGLFLPVETFT